MEAYSLRLIAFDQSTSATGWCVMEQESGSLLDYGVLLQASKIKTNERVRYMVKKCIALCKKHEVTFVFIEGIQVQKNPRAYETLAKLQGTLEICLEEKGYFVNVVKAAEWRKRVGIKNKNRAEVKAEARKMIKDLYNLQPSEDECEAILFARAFSGFKEVFE